MDKVIIFGVNMFSSVVYQSIKIENKAEVLCFTLNKEYIKDTEFEGCPVIAFEELEERFNMDEVMIAITVGYSKMNSNRRIVYDKCKEKNYRIFTYISDNARVYGGKIGEGSIILPSAFIGPSVEIGKCAIIWNQVCVPHHSKIGSFTHLSSGTVVGGGSNIGSNCFIGMNCSIKNGIEIGDNTFVGANSYMTESTPGGLGFYGNPAKNPKGISADIMMQFVE
ncbi:MAG: hypothetical protein MJY89_06640 [Bacteroidales bacterium]|nr:hypothetical protein [Bacteroidales bacterium]